MNAQILPQIVASQPPDWWSSLPVLTRLAIARRSGIYVAAAQARIVECQAAAGVGDWQAVASGAAQAVRSIETHQFVESMFALARDQ